MFWIIRRCGREYNSQIEKIVPSKERAIELMLAMADRGKIIEEDNKVYVLEQYYSGVEFKEYEAEERGFD